MLTFKFRLHPNKSQADLLWKHANRLNRLYNYFLDQKIVAYETNGTSISKLDQQKELVELKKEDPTLKEIHSQACQHAIHRLHQTYAAFFKKNSGFPNFRSCKNFFGILYPQAGFRFEKNKFITKIYGAIPFSKHRQVLGNVRQVYLTCDVHNHWWICISTDYVKNSTSSEEVGIDVGLTNLVATSDNQIVRTPGHAKYFDKKINALKSRRDKNCTKGSRKYKRISRSVKKLYVCKNRKVNDFLHKVSTNLSREYGTIFIEDLELKKMSESDISGINRELRNSCLARFLAFLGYKCRSVFKVPPAYTSQTCNVCGARQKMPLWVRVYRCPACGHVEDRDVNAAKNIFCSGRAIFCLAGAPSATGPGRICTVA